MFKPSEKVIKLKTQVLTLSIVCLFISISGALPKKIALIGLDLSLNSDISGWFLLVITAYFFVNFLVTLGLEIVKDKLPDIIKLKTSKTKGGTIGLTQQEIHEQNQFNEIDDYLVGTVPGEVKDIEIRKQEITTSYINIYGYIHNSWIYLIDYILPIFLCLYSIYSLRNFLLTGNALKFT
jgi:hypothetical protein